MSLLFLAWQPAKAAPFAVAVNGGVLAIFHSEHIPERFALVPILDVDAAKQRMAGKLGLDGATFLHVKFARDFGVPKENLHPICFVANGTEDW